MSRSGRDAAAASASAAPMKCRVQSLSQGAASLHAWYQCASFVGVMTILWYNEEVADSFPPYHGVKVVFVDPVMNALRIDMYLSTGYREVFSGLQMRHKMLMILQSAAICAAFIALKKIIAKLAREDEGLFDQMTTNAHARMLLLCVEALEVVMVVQSFATKEVLADMVPMLDRSVWDNVMYPVLKWGSLLTTWWAAHILTSSLLAVVYRLSVLLCTGRYYPGKHGVRPYFMAFLAARILVTVFWWYADPQNPSVTTSSYTFAFMFMKAIFVNGIINLEKQKEQLLERKRSEMHSNLLKAGKVSSGGGLGLGLGGAGGISPLLTSVGLDGDGAGGGGVGGGFADAMGAGLGGTGSPVFMNNGSGTGTHTTFREWAAVTAASGGEGAEAAAAAAGGGGGGDHAHAGSSPLPGMVSGTWQRSARTSPTPGWEGEQPHAQQQQLRLQQQQQQGGPDWVPWDKVNYPMSKVVVVYLGRFRAILFGPLILITGSLLVVLTPNTLALSVVILTLYLFLIWLPAAISVLSTDFFLNTAGLAAATWFLNYSDGQVSHENAVKICAIFVALVLFFLCTSYAWRALGTIGMGLVAVLTAASFYNLRSFERVLGEGGGGVGVGGNATTTAALGHPHTFQQDAGLTSASLDAAAAAEFAMSDCPLACFAFKLFVCVAVMTVGFSKRLPPPSVTFQRLVTSFLFMVLVGAGLVVSWAVPAYFLHSTVAPGVTLVVVLLQCGVAKDWEASVRCTICRFLFNITQAEGEGATQAEPSSPPAGGGVDKAHGGYAAVWEA